MLDWLRNLLHRVERLIPRPVRDVIGWASSAVAGLFGTITNDVYDAWTDFWAAVWAVGEGIRLLTTELVRKLDQIIGHWIPRYAITAWWWVTHPDQLASVLFWHLVKWLEQRAFTAARYLGNFALALVLHHVKRFVLLLEDVITAVL